MVEILTRLTESLELSNAIDGDGSDLAPLLAS